MSQERLAPQRPEECLIQSRKSSGKGGTVIAADVWSEAEHRKRLGLGEQSYRNDLQGCPRCKHAKLHVHDYRERKALGVLLVMVVVTVVRFICANAECRATWQVLPAFVARHLWWSWPAVERSTSMVAEQETAPSATSVPEAPVAPSTRTKQRWRSRLDASAIELVQLLLECGDRAARSVAKAMRAGCTRAELILVYAQSMQIDFGRRYAVVAALVDDLERGIRLM